MNGNYSIGELVCETCLDAQSLSMSEGEPWIIPPWEDMRKLVGGSMRPGLWVHASGAATGKSQFAMQLAMATAQTGGAAHWVDLENGADVTGSRIVGLINNIPWGMVLRGKVPLEYNGTFEDAHIRAMNVVREMDITFSITDPDEFGYIELELIVADLVKRAKGGPAILVIDYAQIAAEGFSGTGDTRSDVKAFAKTLRKIAKLNKIVVWAISSISREKWAGLASGMKEGARGAAPLYAAFKTPAPVFMGVGAESSGIEYWADAVLVSLPATRNYVLGGRMVPVAVAKQRSESDGWLNFRFDGLRFHEMAVPL